MFLVSMLVHLVANLFVSPGLFALVLFPSGDFSTHEAGSPGYYRATSIFVERASSIAVPCGTWPTLYRWESYHYTSMRMMCATVTPSTIVN